jgi:DNA-binding NarL/FixJ family response regulator
MTEMRVLLADDHSLFRNGIASLLKSRKDIQVVGEASDGEEPWSRLGN